MAGALVGVGCGQIEVNLPEGDVGDVGDRGEDARFERDLGGGGGGGEDAARDTGGGGVVEDTGGGGVEDTGGGGGEEDAGGGTTDPPVPPSDPVEDKVTAGCTTSQVRGLSEQLIAQMNCIQPGVMSSFGHIENLNLQEPVFPYLQTPAVGGLEDVMRGQGELTLSSALRTLPQQYLLYRWYQLGRCGIGLAARPGRSNHNGGLAVDTPGWDAWRSRFTSNGWSWLGSSDPVHFDYGQGEDVRSLSVLAFQQLWNANNPGDTIAEDGLYGPQTEGRLKASPSGGFAMGPACATAGLALPGAGEGIGLELGREGGRAWARAVAPWSVAEVRWYVNGEFVGGRFWEGDQFEVEWEGAGEFEVVAVGYDELGDRLGEARARWGDGLVRVEPMGWGVSREVRVVRGGE
jgi:hypothetical protein